MTTALASLLFPPAGATVAIVTGHRLVAALLLLVGCGASAAWYRRRCRAALVDARRDPLTGLPNRAVLDEALARATRNHAPLSVALVDLDGLHAINASLGHAAGDQHLVSLAARLSTAVPAGGLLVRQGGDEFTLLAPHVEPTDLARALGAALAGPGAVAAARTPLRASVGIATNHVGAAGARGSGVASHDAAGTSAGRDGDARYARGCADAALFTAKAAGGNQILIYDADRDGVPTSNGVRPQRRRRDRTPSCAPGCAGTRAWLPTPAGALVPLLLPISDLRALHHALTVTAAWWRQAAADARADEVHAGAARAGVAGLLAALGATPNGPATHSATPDSAEPQAANTEPSPNASLASVAADRQHTYQQLADRLVPLLDATAHLEPLPAERWPGMAAALLVGVSAAFPPADLEQLVSAAAQAAHGVALSARQRRLAARAHSLLTTPITELDY